MINESQPEESARTAVTANILPNLPWGSWDTVSLNDYPWDTAYPILTFNYLLVDRSLVSIGEKGGALFAFLQFIMQPFVQGRAAQDGYFPLPSHVMQYNMNSVGDIVVKAGVSSAAYFSPIEDPTLGDCAASTIITPPSSQASLTAFLALFIICLVLFLGSAAANVYFIKQLHFRRV